MSLIINSLLKNSAPEKLWALPTNTHFFEAVYPQKSPHSFRQFCTSIAVSASSPLETGPASLPRQKCNWSYHCSFGRIAEVCFEIRRPEDLSRSIRADGDSALTLTPSRSKSRDQYSAKAIDSFGAAYQLTRKPLLNWSAHATNMPVAALKGITAVCQISKWRTWKLGQ